MIRFNSQPALKTSFIGFGQGGCRIVDIFASFKGIDGKPYYSTYGLNSNRNDFMELKFIPQNNLVSLDKNGFGKDPSEAIDVLSMDETSKLKINNLVERFYDEEKDLFIFCTTLGGGTGTSTIVKTLEAYIDKYITPKIEKVLKRMLEQEGISIEQFNQFPLEQQNQAKIKAFQTGFKLGFIKKVGIIATIPVRSDGPNTLAQVNKFANYLWQLAKNPLKGIAFITFPDNQKFYDVWSKNKESLPQTNYRDYANIQAAEIFHELNMATNMGGTDVTFDPKDFRKVMLEGEGCLNLNRIAKNVNQITSSQDMYDLLKAAFEGSLLHEHIRLQVPSENDVKMDDEFSKTQMIHQKVFNVGLLSITNNDKKDLGSAYLDEVKEHIANTIYMNGSIFTGNVKLEKTSFQAVVYAFYKTLGLPERLSKGLVEELDQYRKQKGSVKFNTDTIQTVETLANDQDISAIQEVSIEGSLSAGLGFLKGNLSDQTSDNTETDKNEEKNTTSSLGSNLDWLKDWN